MVNRRKRIGFLFTSIGRESMGVLNYFISIIKAVDSLPDNEKPQFVVIYDEHIKKWVEAIQYSHLELHLVKKQSLIKTLLKSFITGINFFVGNIIKEYSLDGLYPMNDYVGKIKYAASCKIISWYPDFQHKFYPQYFTKSNLIIKEWRLKQIIKKGRHLVLSSNHSKSHLMTFYKPTQLLQIHILPFVSILSQYQLPAFQEMKIKYDVNEPYFFLANQFYKHKNHILVFEAVKLLREKGIFIKLVCSGKLEDYRNPDYIEQVKTYVIDNNLQNDIKMLGIIPREDQLCLMKNCLAVIQPSKFEGWSTVIEDAKTLQMPILASTFGVHKEQLEDKGLYFDEDSSQSLATLLEGYLNGSVKRPLPFDNYEQRVAKFARLFIDLYK
ncbi:glycosyltransferase family 4 protein [Segetibacter aerophilus]|nr:glycosyltransferase family 1 protein [Segetibacter aerophilus]